MSESTACKISFHSNNLCDISFYHCLKRCHHVWSTSPHFGLSDSMMQLQCKQSAKRNWRLYQRCRNFWGQWENSLNPRPRQWWMRLWQFDQVTTERGGLAGVMNWWSKQNDWTIRCLRKALWGKSMEPQTLFAINSFPRVCVAEIYKTWHKGAILCHRPIWHKNRIAQNYQHMIHSLFILKFQCVVGISIKNWVKIR